LAWEGVILCQHSNRKLTSPIYKTLSERDPIDFRVSASAK